LLTVVLSTHGSACAAKADISDLLGRVHWGETSQDLLRQFDGAATQVSPSLDFGDSYVDVVLEGATLGGVPIVTFFQMAFEGCLFGVASGYCGLRGQLVVRISPAAGEANPDPCHLAARGG